MLDEDTHQRADLWFLIILALTFLAISVFYFSSKNSDFKKAPQLSVEPSYNRPVRLYTVSYISNVFSPTNLRIHSGDSVNFQNKDLNPIYILTDSNNGLPELSDFDSLNVIAQNQSFAYTFNKVGIFGYHNKLNESESGTIIVRP